MQRTAAGDAIIALAGALLVSACFEDTQPNPADSDSAGADTRASTGPVSTDGDGSTAAAGSTAAVADDTTSAGSTAASETTGPAAVAWQQSLVIAELPGSGGDPNPLTDVPVLVRLTAERFDYATAASDASDLRFVTDLSDQTALPHEIEQWDPDGTSLIWVRLPSLNGGDEFLLLHGDTGVAPWSDPSDVWSSGYVGVWHFTEQDDDGGFADSTAQDNTMLPDGRDLDISIDTGPGGYGNALQIAELDRMTVADDASLDLASALTVEAWVQPSVVSTTAMHRTIVDKPSAYRLAAVHEVSGLPFMNLRDVTGTQVTATGDDGLGASSWTHVVGTFDGTVVRLYIDGVQAAQMMAGGNVQVSETPLLVGTLYGGRIDEVRVAAIDRTPQWIEVQRRSMLDDLITYSDDAPL